MLTRISNFHFTPTQVGYAALTRKDMPTNKIFITGNTVVDAQHWVIKKYAIHTQDSLGKNLLVTICTEEKIEGAI
ncbi:MAG TPA: hypothetical protein DCW35_00295 [Polynucleobacter sp.]|nr:hypothetical protein [Polynucleobacter sp.]